jgi:hypothetical protein
MPRKSNPDNYANMAEAAGPLGIPKELLIRCKADGAPGFNGSRVNALEFMPWWKKHGDRIKKEIGTGGSLRDKKLTQEIIRLEIANKKADGKLLDKRQNDEFQTRSYKQFEAVLYQKYCVELPAAAANQDAPAIQIMAVNYLKTAMREMKDWLKEYAPSEPSP